eukprot:jgi/Botrbrau1/17110/Bobra.0157s0012.1
MERERDDLGIECNSQMKSNIAHYVEACQSPCKFQSLGPLALFMDKEFFRKTFAKVFFIVKAGRDPAHHVVVLRNISE